MLILGLLLLAATGAFVGLLIADNLAGGPEYTVTVLGNTITTMSSFAIFCAGLALALIFCLGLAMMLGSAMQHRRQATRINQTAGPAADEPATADEHGRRRTRHIFGH